MPDGKYHYVDYLDNDKKQSHENLAVIYLTQATPKETQNRRNPRILLGASILRAARRPVGRSSRIGTDLSIAWNYSRFRNRSSHFRNRSSDLRHLELAVTVWATNDLIGQ